MFVPNRELGSFLLDSRLLSRAELESLLVRVGEGTSSLYEHLQRSASVPEDELTRAAAYVLGVPFTPISHEHIASDALMLVPEPLARTRSLAAFARGEHHVDVLLLDLDDLPHLEFLEREQHLRVVPHLTDRASIKRALLVYQKLLREKYGEKLKHSQGEAVLDALLAHALVSQATEIHLEPLTTGEVPELRVRYRIRGHLYDAMLLPKQTADLASRIKQLANLSFTLPVPQEGRFKVMLEGGGQLRVRAATLPVSGGEKITLHIAREQAGQKGFTLESLGFHGEALEEMHRALAGRSGLVLVAGPEGAGKTTMLYTMLDYIASPHLAILSVEETIGMPLPQIMQTGVRRDLGQTYVSTVRAALTHHPDVLMIGELKDDDTAHLAAAAAGRGMLVIAGINAPSASLGIQQMLAFGVNPLLLAASLRAAIGTRVVKKICPHCKEDQKLSRIESSSLEKQANFGRVLAALRAEGAVEEGKQWKELWFVRPGSCTKCEQGYNGMIGLEEVLTVSAITRELIVSSNTEENLDMKGEQTLSIVEDGLFKAAQGKTSVEEILKLIK